MGLSTPPLFLRVTPRLNIFSLKIPPEEVHAKAQRRGGAKGRKMRNYE